jgi:phosphohistidine phosphatase
MALFLVQHGKSLPKEEDPDRGLSKVGMEETRTVAELAADQNIQVSRLLKDRALRHWMMLHLLLQM